MTVGPVECAVRAAIPERTILPTVVRAAPFEVEALEERHIVLRVGKRRTSTTVRWEQLEDVPSFLAKRGWVEIGSRYEVVGDPTTLDGFLKQDMKRSGASYVATILERASVIEVDREPPARVQLLTGFD